MMRKIIFSVAALTVVGAEDAPAEDWTDEGALSLLQMRAAPHRSHIDSLTTFNDGDRVRGRNKKCRGGMIVRFNTRNGQGKSFDDCRAECLLLPNCRFFAHWSVPMDDCRLYRGRCRNTDSLNGPNRNVLYEITRGEPEPIEGPTVDVDPTPEAPVDPMPADAAKAVDDPHILDAAGKNFDLFESGKHVLLAIPKGAPPSDALIHVAATVEKGGERDNDLWIRRLLIRGEWAGHNIAFKTNSAEYGSPSNTLMRVDDGAWMTPDEIANSPLAPASFIVHNGVVDQNAPQTQFAQSISKKIEMTMGPLNLDVKWGTSQTEGKGHNHIDFHVRGLSKVDEDIGGLLGGSEGEAQSLLRIASPMVASLLSVDE